MEKRLEKQCKTSDLELGGRYCMSSSPSRGYVFTVTKIKNRLGELEITGKFIDGSYGLFFSNLDYNLYEYPLTPLERELL